MKVIVFVLMILCMSASFAWAQDMEEKDDPPLDTNGDDLYLNGEEDLKEEKDANNLYLNSEKDLKTEDEYSQDLYLDSLPKRIKPLPKMNVKPEEKAKKKSRKERLQDLLDRYQGKTKDDQAESEPQPESEKGKKGKKKGRLQKLLDRYNAK